MRVDAKVELDGQQHDGPPLNKNLTPSSVLPPKEHFEKGPPLRLNHVLKTKKKNVAQTKGRTLEFF